MARVEATCTGCGVGNPGLNQVAKEMNGNIANIAEVTQETTDSAQETVAAGEAIGEQMERLREVIAGFKTGGTSLDLTKAKTAHLAWRGRIRAYLHGKGSLTLEQAVSHHDCVLGKWYYGEGLEQFGDFAEMRELEKPHERLHQLIREIIQLNEAGREEDAKEAAKQIDSLSEEIVGLLNHIEEKAMAQSG